MEAVIPPGGKAGDNLRLSVRGRRQRRMHWSVQKEIYCVALPVAFRCCFGAWQRKVVSRTCNVDYQLEIDRTIQSYQKAVQLWTAVVWAAGAVFTLDFACDSWHRGVQNKQRKRVCVNSTVYIYFSSASTQSIQFSHVDTALGFMIYTLGLAGECRRARYQLNPCRIPRRRAAKSRENACGRLFPEV